MPVIDAILDPSFKSGVSSAGKPWVLMKVKVGDNEATGFAPLAIGDEVALNYNAQYKNYSVEKLTPAKKERDELMSKVDEILSILKAGLQGRGETPSPQKATQGLQRPVSPAPDLPPVDSYEAPF